MKTPSSKKLSKPRAARVRPFKFAKTLEKPLQDVVLQWLKISGYYHKRVPIGAYPYRRGDGQVGWGKNPMKGFPDILVVLKNRPGQMCVIELKSSEGKVSPDQRVEMDALAKAGVLVIVARSLTAVVDILRREDVAVR